MDLTAALSAALEGLDADDRERVVSAIEDADQYRAAADAGDLAAESELAWAIGRVGHALDGVGRPEHALAALTEAVERYRRLVAVRPDELDALGRWSRSLRDAYRKLGRHDEELAAARESLAVYRRLFEANPRYDEELALELGWLAKTLSRLGRHDEALAVAAEEVDLMRGRPTDEPDMVDFLLVLALRGHRDRLVDAGRRSEALAVAGEVVDLYRRMVAEDSDMLGDLPGELDIYSDRLRDVGRHADAEAVYVEIVQIFRDLVATRGEPWMRLGVVAAVINSGRCLGRIGRYDEALARANEAAALARSLIEGDRGEGDRGEGDGGEGDGGEGDRVEGDRVEAESSLAIALNNASVDLIRLNRYDEAVDAATESVQIRRRLAASDAAGPGPGLAMALNTLGEALSGSGRYAEAVAASAEAYDRYRGIVDAGAAGHDGEWADCLETFAAVRLAARVELAEALRAAEESVAVYERLRDDPRFENRLDDAVRTRAALLALDG